MAAERTRTASFATLAVGLVAGYVGLAFALGESYPLSPLGMFASTQTAATRVVVRTASGALAEVTSFDAWSCDEPLALQGLRSPLPYSAQDERVMQYIRENGRSPGSPGEPDREPDGREPVSLVRLVFHIRRPGAPIESEEHPLAACRAWDRRQPSSARPPAPASLEPSAAPAPSAVPEGPR